MTGAGVSRLFAGCTARNGPADSGYKKIVSKET